MASKLCDSCKSASATLFCRADAAFLCVSCDADVHAANKLASRHARVWLCEVCEQAPAHVTCKADAAALCVTCDRDIHSANPLARRHERLPVAPIFDSPATKSAINFFFSDADEAAEEASTEEAEAASWLLPNPKAAGADSPDLNSSGGPYGFPEMEPYLDLDYGAVDLKLEARVQNSSGADGVVPVAVNTKSTAAGAYLQAPIANDQCYEINFSAPSKPFVYGYNTHCLSQSVSSSSLDVGVVPDRNAAAAEMSDAYGKTTESSSSTAAAAAAARQAVPMSAADREARVLRYREKRKNRKFEKTIRYASRKAYAETRPRIKGRFAKRTEVDLEADRISGYGVVPTF